MKQDVYTSEAQLQAMLDELEHAHDSTARHIRALPEESCSS